jgi:DNA-binding PadR family transcriptional regulator
MTRRPNASRQTQALLSALLVAQDAWHYGYDLSKATGLKSGTLYPILMRLERQGWLEARWEAAATSGKPARHLYRLTPLGASEAGTLIRPAERLQVLDALRPAREGGST